MLAVSLAAVRTKTFFNRSVSRFVPSVPEYDIIVIFIAFGYFFHEPYSGFFCFGIGKARNPTARIERPVRAAAYHFALRSDTRSAVFFKEVLRRALQKEFDYDFQALLFCKRHKFVHVVEGVNAFLALVIAPVYAYLNYV